MNYSYMIILYDLINNTNKNFVDIYKKFKKIATTQLIKLNNHIYI
jgi:hypothetical protein